MSIFCFQVEIFCERTEKWYDRQEDVAAKTELEAYVKLADRLVSPHVIDSVRLSHH